MKTKFILVFLSFLQFSLTNVYSQSCTVPIRIVVLGASTAYGLGASVPDSAWVNRYREFLVDSVNSSSEVINLAKPGYTTYAFQPTGYIPPPDRIDFPVDTERNISKALSLFPDGIILNLPTNDANELFTIEEQKTNCLRVTHVADSVGVPVWVTTTSPRNFTNNPDSIKAIKKQLLVDMRDTVIALYPQRYIEFFVGLADSNVDILPEYDSGDGVHVNDAGHHILFDRVRDTGIHDTLCSVPTFSNSHMKVEEFVPYPNPLVLSGTNHFTIISSSCLNCEAEILNGLGQHIATLKFVDSKMMWDGRDGNGEEMNPGLFLYRVSNSAGEIKSIGKICVVR